MFILVGQSTGLLSGARAATQKSNISTGVAYKL
jgi:hypothetical protein